DLYYKPDVVSYSDYFPGHGLLNGRNGNSDEYRYGGANGQEKVDEISGLGNHYTAEYWEYDSRVLRRWNRDPKPNPSFSEYACFANNPIVFVDILGDTSEFYNISTGELMGTVNDDSPLRRIKVDEEAFLKAGVSSLSLFASGYMQNNSAVERNNFLAESIIGLGQLNESLKGPDSERRFISFETGELMLLADGSMRNDIIADVEITLSSRFDDGSLMNIDSWNGTAGGYGNGPPENGDYSVSNWQDRSPTGWYNSGMNLDGVGFSFNLDPTFDTGRSLLRIHPDGNN